MTTFSKVTPTTKFSETQFYSVKKIGAKEIEVVNDSGEEITLGKSYVEKLLVSSDEVNETKKMSRTELTNLFLANSNVIMKVTYNKKVNEKEVEKSLAALYPNTGGKILSKADYEKQVKTLLKSALVGEERVMVGRHYGNQDEFGRVHFVDMEADKGDNPDYDGRLRLVDTRTISCLVLRGVQYCVK